jgi:hypothetical protein
MWPRAEELEDWSDGLKMKIYIQSTLAFYCWLAICYCVALHGPGLTPHFASSTLLISKSTSPVFRYLTKPLDIFCPPPNFQHPIRLAWHVLSHNSTTAIQQASICSISPGCQPFRGQL